jgi:hypothetical protein
MRPVAVHQALPPSASADGDEQLPDSHTRAPIPLCTDYSYQRCIHRHQVWAQGGLRTGGAPLSPESHNAATVFTLWRGATLALHCSGNTISVIPRTFLFAFKTYSIELCVARASPCMCPGRAFPLPRYPATPPYPPAKPPEGRGASAQIPQ